MCQKVKQLWQCGHTNTEDPRRCLIAWRRNRSTCHEYGFAWAFRDPVLEEWQGDCINCQRGRIEQAKQDANKKFVDTSKAYPRLRDVSAHDDETRQMFGRPRFDRSASTSEICIPPGWTPAQNRLPSNANEYEQFMRGRFNTLQKLPAGNITSSDRVSVHQRRGAQPQRRPHPPMLANTEPLPENPTYFQPGRHAFTEETQNRKPRISTTTTTAPKSYRPRPPPPGFAPHIPHDTQIARYMISRHSRAQMTPPLQAGDCGSYNEKIDDSDDADPGAALADAVILDEEDCLSSSSTYPSSEYAFAQYCEEVIRRQQMQNQETQRFNGQVQQQQQQYQQCQTDVVPASRHRPSYSCGVIRTGQGTRKGWMPPMITPLPPRQETDTAPPSRSGSHAREMVERVGAMGLTWEGDA